MHHLLIAFPFATFLWRTVHVALNLPLPTSTDNMVVTVCGLEAKTKPHICVGVYALFSALWNCHNDFFYQSEISQYLLVIFYTIGWTRMSLSLGHAEVRDHMVFGYNQ